MKKGYHPCVPGQCRTLWPVQDSACGGTVWVDVLKAILLLISRMLCDGRTLSPKWSCDTSYTTAQCAA